MIKYTLDRVFSSNKSKTYHLIDDGFLSKQEDKFPIKDYKDDDTIFMRNQTPKFFFYVESGKVLIVSKEEKIVATFVPGDSFGEMALFTDSVRSVTAKSVGNSTLQLVSAEFIKDFFEKEDPLIKFCLICILERLRAMNNLRNLIT
jgi:CRP-like cAMP-binding protein